LAAIEIDRHQPSGLKVVPRAGFCQTLNEPTVSLTEIEMGDLGAFQGQL
jgi:hypothetical protein